MSETRALLLTGSQKLEISPDDNLRSDVEMSLTKFLFQVCRSN